MGVDIDKSCYMTRVWWSDYDLDYSDVPIEGRLDGKLLDLEGHVHSDAMYVEIGDTVTSIGNDAFRDCKKLVDVFIPESVREICDFAFIGCELLKEIHFPSSLQKIGICAFSGCSSLVEVEIPDGVVEIGESAFFNCSELTHVVVPKSVKSIGYWAFSNSNSAKITFVGRTENEIEDVENYPWEIDPESSFETS